MRLYFLRHGIAADKSTWVGPDAERPLTAEGRAGVERVADGIAKLDLDVQRLLTSPFPRASQTADIVARRIGALGRLSADPRLEPGFDSGQLERIVREFESKRSILLVGHEPDFSVAISDVIGGGRLRLKKAALVRIDIEETQPLRGKLVWLIPPGVWG